LLFSDLYFSMALMNWSSSEESESIMMPPSAAFSLVIELSTP
jgi:hypothetical protein